MAKTKPGFGLMLWRGARLRCPRCGSGSLFRGWFSMKDRCPRCDYVFAREEGFWLGGFVINFALGEGLLALHLIVFAVVLVSRPDMAVKPWLIAAVALALIPPVLFFPVSRTIWAAIDLAMHPAPGDDA